MTTENELCTFTATVRVDLRMIASLAKYMYSKGIFKGSTGKVASEAVKILANTTQTHFPIKSHTEAITELRKMGYEDPLQKGTKYYNALYGQIELEQQSKESQESINEKTARLVKEYNKKHSSNTPTIDKTALKSVIAPVEDEVESPQLKIRTSEDERTDISKIRTAMSVPEGAPVEVLEENKTNQ